MSAHQLWDPEYGCYISVLFTNSEVPFASITSIQAISDDPMATYTIKEAEAYWQDQIEVEL